jgi:NADH-quinone oxidoreductase subunit L
VAALFHLTTHAFFKSLLFLGAGVIIHAARTQDIRQMGGLRKSLPWTTAAFTAGALALSGVFPFSGFWSKDDILTTLWSGGHYLAFGFALLTALLTAFYMARLWFRVFGAKQACSLAREAHVEMIAPMVFLGLVTLVIGFTGPAFAGLLGEQKGWPDIAMAVTSSAVALSGIGAGWFVYGRGAVDTDAVKRRLGWAYQVLANNLYFDLTYSHWLVRPYVAATELLARFDTRVIDGAVNGVATGWRSASEAGWTFDARVIDGAVNGATLVRAAGARLRTLQGGRVQSYQRLAFAALLVLLALPLLWNLVVILLKGA